MTLRTLNYGNYGIFLIMGNAGFCPSTVVQGLQGFWGLGLRGGRRRLGPDPVLRPTSLASFLSICEF